MKKIIIHVWKFFNLFIYKEIFNHLDFNENQVGTGVKNLQGARLWLAVFPRYKGLVPNSRVRGAHEKFQLSRKHSIH